MQKITPRTLAGFMELEPKEQIVFTEMQDIIKKTFEINGLVPLDTPIVELSDVLLVKAGGETEKQVYRFNKGENDLCLRFDLTVPLAKYVAMHKNELIFPFRRYQIGKVYRGERTQKGRFREFYQCDMDIIGDGALSVLADADCISVLSQIYWNLGVNITIRVNNRKILNGYLSEFGLENSSAEIIRIFDKFEKIGYDETLELLKEITPKAEEIIKILTAKTIQDVEKLKVENQLFRTGLEEINQVFSALENMNVKNQVVFDIKIARGLDYYTGTVFEAVLNDAKEKISVGGGGRYDNLAEYYTEAKLPGVGMSVGLTRVFDILKTNNLIKFGKSTCADVAIIPLGETLNECLKLSETLKQNQVKTDLYYFDKGFKQKMNIANRQGMKYVLIVGENEVASKKYALKNMESGEQELLTVEEIVKKIKG